METLEIIRIIRKREQPSLKMAAERLYTDYRNNVKFEKMETGI